MSDQIVTLDTLVVGQRAVINDLEDNSAITRRLEEMGLTPGEEVEIIRLAPLGDPIEIRIRGYLLSLRKDEAKWVKVKMMENN